MLRKRKAPWQPRFDSSLQAPGLQCASSAPVQSGARITLRGEPTIRAKTEIRGEASALTPAWFAGDIPPPLKTAGRRTTADVARSRSHAAPLKAASYRTTADVARSRSHAAPLKAAGQRASHPYALNAESETEHATRCARNATVTSREELPVLLVHGLWDSLLRIDPLLQGLRARGIESIRGFDLRPSNGRAPIPELARQYRDPPRRRPIQNAFAGCGHGCWSVVRADDLTWGFTVWVCSRRS